MSSYNEDMAKEPKINRMNQSGSLFIMVDGKSVPLVPNAEQKSEKDVADNKSEAK